MAWKKIGRTNWEDKENRMFLSVFPNKRFMLPKYAYVVSAGRFVGKGKNKRTLHLYDTNGKIISGDFTSYDEGKRKAMEYAEKIASGKVKLQKVV